MHKSRLLISSALLLGLCAASQAAPGRTYYTLGLSGHAQLYTVVYVQNENNKAIEVQVMPVNSQGQNLSEGASSFILQPGATRIFSRGDWPATAESAKFESSVPINVSTYFSSADASRSEIIPALQNSGTQLYFPSLAVDSATEKQILLMNGGDSLDVPVLSALDKHGRVIFERSLPALPAQGTEHVALAELVESSSLADVASVRVRSTQPLRGFQISGVAGGDYAGLPALAGEGTQFFADLSAMRSDTRLWTVIAAFNTSEKPETYHVELLDAQKNTLRPLPDLTASPETAAMLPDLTQYEDADYVKIWSDQSFSAYQVLGNRNTWATAASRLENRIPGPLQVIRRSLGSQLLLINGPVLPDSTVELIHSKAVPEVQPGNSVLMPGVSSDAVVSRTAKLMTHETVGRENIGPLVAPLNDDQSSPFIVATLPYSVGEDIGSATALASDPVQSCQNSQGSNSVWFRYTSTFNGTLKISTLGSSYDTVVSVYPGTTKAGPELACNDDFVFGVTSQVLVPVSTGQSYIIEVAKFGSTPGTGGLNFTVTAVQRRAYKAGVYRSSSALWVIDLDGNGNWDGTSVDRAIVAGTGLAQEVAVTGDWNGDGRAKLGIFRGGTWFLDYNGTGTITSYTGFGTFGDTPVVGDWNGDGRSKIGIFRQGLWLLDFNGNGTFDGGGTTTTVDRVFNLGIAGDIPIVGDWSGNGFSKIGIFRPSGIFFLDFIGNGQVSRQMILGGNPGDIPVVGDWSGSGTSKIGIFRSGLWLLDYNGNFVWDGSPGDRVYGFGQAADTPVVGDWRGTGVFGIGVFRSGQFYLDINANGVFNPFPVDLGFNLGTAGDAPVVAPW